MYWLKPAIVFSALSSALLAATFAYTWAYSLRRRYALLWALAWLAACPHLALAYWLVDDPANTSLWSVSQLFLIANAFLVVSGCLDFAGRRVSVRMVLLLASPFVLWALLAPRFTDAFLHYNLPNSFLLGGAYLWAAALFFGLHRRERLRGTRLAAVLLALAGIHEFDYPLLGQIPGAAPIGYTVAAGLMIALALCLIVMMLDRARHTAEEGRLWIRAILDNLPVGVLVTDPTGGIVLANDMVHSICGDAPTPTLSELEARLFEDCDDPAPISRALRSGAPTPAVEFELEREDGSLRTMLVDASTVSDRDSSTLGAIAVIQDVTQVKRMQRQASRDEQLRGLGTLAAGVAHTFNNSLAVILGHAELAARQGPDATLAPHISAITSAARDSAAIVGRIQDVARTRERRESVPVDLPKITREVIELTRPQWRDEAQARGVAYEVASNLEPDVRILGNSAELRETLINLCLNAFDAMPTGGRLTIAVMRNQEQAALEIADTGVGMSEEVRERIFEPYFTTKEEGGSGLGLALAFGVVEGHGGQIDAVSEIGHGTVFRLTFPIYRGEAAEAPPEPPSPPAESPARVLFVDDEPMVCDLVTKLLADTHHVVETVTSGDEALAVLTKNTFDIVLTDLGMPGTNGWQVATTIRDRGYETTVVLVTGWSDTVSPEEATERGVAHVLAKPFSRDALLDCIHTFAPKRRLHRPL